MKIKIAIHANDTLTDLFHYPRVAVEEFRGRLFLVGVRNSGKVVALYAVRPGVSADRVTNALAAAIGTGKNVCVLSDELVDIKDDAEAAAALAEHNDFTEGLTAVVGQPNTLGG